MRAHQALAHAQCCLSPGAEAAEIGDEFRIHALERTAGGTNPSLAVACKCFPSQVEKAGVHRLGHERAD